MNLLYTILGLILLFSSLSGFIIIKSYLELFWLMCDPIPFKFCGLQLNKAIM